ncbi:conjugal transfer protein TrbH [Burkholderia cenocepacia]|uniref:conjugal transfer protein TrbH n=1 Tax=Burkholderia cenocepacia TaxID=95486 RepID=UPI002ABD549C|nr:conjugal transfer protein TrbH [Burkholderia cenocepacia]
MRKILMSAVVVAGLVVLAGCSTPGPYGNYAAASLDANRSMADSTVAQLVTLYPPAQTRFNLEQPTVDAYGAALVAALRDKGYSVMEYATQTAQPAVAASSASAVNVPPLSSDRPGLDLTYVVDTPESMRLYRVTVQVASKSISRAFVVATDGKLYPAGAWVRKE